MLASLVEGLRGVANASDAARDRVEPTGPLLRVADNPLLLTNPKKRNGFNTEWADQIGLRRAVRHGPAPAWPASPRAARPFLPVELDKPGATDRLLGCFRIVAAGEVWAVVAARTGGLSARVSCCRREGALVAGPAERLPARLPQERWPEAVLAVFPL